MLSTQAGRAPATLSHTHAGYDEARVLYSEGCRATGAGPCSQPACCLCALPMRACMLPTAGSRNPYLWCSWGWLEFKTNNIKRARDCFDAATAADKQHAFAYHMWGTLERNQGDYVKARDKWMQVCVCVSYHVALGAALQCVSRLACLGCLGDLRSPLCRVEVLLIHHCYVMWLVEQH